MTSPTRCPICDAPVTPPPRPPVPDAPKSFFPFCSERCRMVDLGRWLMGHYAIPGESVAEDDAPPPGSEKD